MKIKLDAQLEEDSTKGPHENDKGKEKQGETSEQKSKTTEGQQSSLGSLTVQQLQDMITNTIRAQYGASSRDSLTYSKPYTKRVDALRMPFGYQPPKFQQFEGKGNPKQHIAHFVETCNNAGTEGDHLVKQFVRSLKSSQPNSVK